MKNQQIFNLHGDNLIIDKCGDSIKIQLYQHIDPFGKLKASARTLASIDFEQIRKN